MSAPRRERDVQAAVLALLRANRIPAWKVGTGGFRVGGRYVKMGQKGMSDLIAINPLCLVMSCDAATRPSRPGGCGDPGHWLGQFLAIEIKRPGGKTTAEQRAFQDIVRQAGGLAITATSCDDVIRALGLGR